MWGVDIATVMICKAGYLHWSQCHFFLLSLWAYAIKASVCPQFIRIAALFARIYLKLMTDFLTGLHPNCAQDQGQIHVDGFMGTFLFSQKPLLLLKHWLDFCEIRFICSGYDCFWTFLTQIKHITFFLDVWIIMDCELFELHQHFADHI